jgi:hypothetical protein
LGGVLLVFLLTGLWNHGLAGFDRSLASLEAFLFAIFGVIGFLLLLGLVEMYWREKSPETGMLLLWTFGTVGFASFLNWTVSGRSILPLIPAAVLFMSKVLSQGGDFREFLKDKRVTGVVGLSFLLALGVTWTDSALANTARKAAADIAREFSGIRGKIQFQGHWGFQFYMENLGEIHVDYSNKTWNVQDILIIPIRNSNLGLPDPESHFVLVKVFQYKPTPFLSTMNNSVAAGFYSSLYGPFPFSIGRVQPEDYLAFGHRKVWGNQP